MIKQIAAALTSRYKNSPTPPVPAQHDLALDPRARTRHARAGVERIAISSSLSDEDVESLVEKAIIGLAAQGKRVSTAPKRLQDGVAIDWLYDRSVIGEDVSSILRRVIPDNKDDGRKVGVQTCASTPTATSVPDTVTTSPTQPRKDSHPSLSHRPTSEPICREATIPLYRRCVSENIVPTRRRPRSDSGGQFTLTNLASDTQASEVRSFLEQSGVPEDAIADVRMRTAPVGTVAVVYVVAGHDALSLERKVRGSTAGGAPSRKSGQPVTINLVSDDSDVEVDDSSAVKVTNNAPAVVQAAGDLPTEERELEPRPNSVSPALSYLTLEERNSEHDDPDNMEVDADPAHDEAREGTLSPYSRLRALPSSDQDSGEDEPHDFPSSRHAGIIASEDDATERLLHGEITAVRTFLQDASAEQRQHMRHLSGHASSAAGLSDRPLRQEDSDSDSDLRVEQQSSVRRHEQGMSRHPLRTRKGPTKGLSGAAVPKPTSDRAVPGDSGGVSVTLPKAEHAKGRRLVVPADPSLPIAAVYMRGDCQFIHQGSRAHIARFSLPAEKARRGVASRHVVDAVAVDARTIVIGYDAGPTQVSCLLLGSERPRHVDVPHRGHTTVVEHASGTSSQNPGISALAALPADGGGRRRFLSGGGDGSVRLWTLAGADGARRGASTPLALAPGQPVRCLAYRASDGAVFAGHARHVSCAHVEAARAGKPALLSAAPLQVHVHPQDPRVVLLEVDHLDRQVQIFDLRRNLDMGPVMEFGHRAAPSMSPARHMYRRGSTSHTLFARGYGDGTLCVWDYRNKSNVLLQSRAREDPIVHAVLNGDQVIAYGAYRVTFWSLTDF